MELKVDKIENLVKQSPIPTITLYRINYGGKRGYADPKPFNVYSGLTGALSAATFKGNQDNKRLDKWRDTMVAELGNQEKQEAYLNSMADFGTHLHETLVKIKDKGGLNWKEEREEAYHFFMQSAKRNGILPSMNVIEKQVFEYCKHAASLMQFCYENVSTIYAIESMVKSDELQIATPIDMVIDYKQNGGDIRVGLNIKTSNQIGNHQLEQAGIEKYLWNLTYPEFPIVKTGIIRGKDWNLSKEPTYELKLVDPAEDEETLKDTLARLRLCKSNPLSTYINFPKSVGQFSGETKLGEKPKIIWRPMEEVFLEALSKGEML